MQNKMFPHKWKVLFSKLVYFDDISASPIHVIIGFKCTISYSVLHVCVMIQLSAAALKRQRWGTDMSDCKRKNTFPLVTGS